MKSLAKESMIIGRATSSVQAFLRKHQRKLKLTRPWLKWYMMDSIHGKDCFKIFFCPKVPGSKGKQHQHKPYSTKKSFFQHKKPKPAYHQQK